MSPRAAASAPSFPHASRNAGIALGSSTATILSTGLAPPDFPALRAPSAPADTDFGAPVVRALRLRKNEGRELPVSRAETRHSESGRQDLNLRPLAPERRLKPAHPFHTAAHGRKRLMLLQLRRSKNRTQLPIVRLGCRRGLRADCGPPAVATSPGLRPQTKGTKVHDLPAVQLALFLEAGANVAAQAAGAGATKEQVEAILRRAGDQAAAVAGPPSREDR